MHLQLAERGQPQSTPLKQLCTQPTDAATVQNIFGTPVVELFSAQSLHFLWMLTIS
jgi:hypothetical protein